MCVLFTSGPIIFFVFTTQFLVHKAFITPTDECKYIGRNKRHMASANVFECNFVHLDIGHYYFYDFIV